MADTENKVDSTIGGLANLSNAPDDALLVVEYLGKAYNSTMAQLKAALGAITGFAKTAGDSTPGTNDVYTITFGNGGKLDITIPIPKNGENGYTPQKGVDYNDGYTPQKGVDYHDGYTPQKGKDYADGISPTVDFKQMEDGVEITITDATGPHTAKLKNGADGVSPSFRVETIEGGYRVILSAAHEYQQFDLLNGEVGDWNVNNPAWKNYIKGRTHWKEEYGVDGVVIEETSVTFSGTTQFQTISGIMSEAIQVGGKYTVTYNGVDYACIGKYYDGAYIGNGSFMNVGVGNEEDTGEPFCIQLFGGDIYMLWKADKTKETVTVKVVGEKVVIWHKLDGGYLPEGVPYVESNVVEILPETTAAVDSDTGSAILPDGVDLVAGNAYTVNYNGVEYPCVAQLYEEDGMELGCMLGNVAADDGTGDTGEPFFMVCIFAEMVEAIGVGMMIMPLDGSASVTLSISSGSRTVHKISAELLTEGTPCAEPFDDVIMAAWPSSITSEGTFTDPTGTLVVGNIYKVNWGGTIYECTAKESSDYGVYLGNLSALGGEASADPFGILLVWPPLRAELGAAGIILFDNAPANYEFSIIGGWKVQQIDKRCLPVMPEPLFVPITYANGEWSCTVPYAAIKAALTGETPRLVYLVDPNNQQASDLYKYESQSGGTLWFSRLSFAYDSADNLSVCLELMGIASSSTTITRITNDLI